jgi:signal recognition particle receptor subunit beta
MAAFGADYDTAFAQLLKSIPTSAKPQTLKVVVTGPLGAGKTTFIKSLSEGGIVPIDTATSEGRTLDKALKAIAMDCGWVPVDDNSLIYLFGTPENRRFDFMWEILAEGMLGFIVIVDSSIPETFLESKAIMETYRAYAPTPIVIALNKQDKAEAVTADQFRALSGVGDEVKIVPSVALNPDSARNALLELIYLVLEEIETE